MSSHAGGYDGGAEHHCHGYADFLLHHHAQHVAAGQLYHVPQHSRREKLRFPAPDAAADSPPCAWPTPPPPPPFYSYASSSTSSYSPHSPSTLPHAQLVSHAGGLAAQIPTQNFALSLSSNPPATTRPLHGGGPYGPFTGYAAVLGRSRFLAPAERLLQEICDVGGAVAHVDRSVSDEGLLDTDPMEAIHHDVDGGDRAASDAGPISGADQQWRKTRLISMMEEVVYLNLLCSVLASRAPPPVFSSLTLFRNCNYRSLLGGDESCLWRSHHHCSCGLTPAFIHCSCMCL
jgi:hypothetical protein